MLDGQSSRWAHAGQNIVLIVLSITTLPISLSVLLAIYVVGSIANLRVERHRNALRQDAGFRPRTILVTGVGMTKGLTLARLFHKAGHNVIGADFSALACGSVSRSLTMFHHLQAPDPQHKSGPYVRSLLDLIVREKVDLWVSCSGVASAVEDGEARDTVVARTDCRAIQFDVKTTQMLHEKDSFIKRARDIGLNVPETHTITDRVTAEQVFHKAPPGREFIMKPIGVDDSARGDMTLLPKTTNVETSRHLDNLQISTATPYILQTYVRGEEYCTHSLVVDGKVEAFVACPSSELLMHYVALPPDSSLSLAMLNFTKRFADAHGHGFTGHLSFDFLVEESTLHRPQDIRLFPIECNPRAHTAVILFSDTPALVDCYLKVFDRPGSVSRSSLAVTPARPKRYYWVGHDITTLMLSLASSQPMQGRLNDLIVTLAHFLTWHDGTFTWWDPLPAFWLYHIYWPLRLVDVLMSGKRWSRLNVSTTKMFMC